MEFGKKLGKDGWPVCHGCGDKIGVQFCAGLCKRTSAFKEPERGKAFLFCATCGVSIETTDAVLIEKLNNLFKN